MKKIAWPVIVLTLLLQAAGAEAAKQPRVDGERLEFTLHDLDGDEVTSSDERFEGKVVLVDLWGTWCPPCVSEIPTLVEVQERYESEGLVIVAIAFEGDDDAGARREYLREFVVEHGINYLVLDGGPPEDFEQALPAVRNVRGFPVEIFVDRTGKVAMARNSFGYKKSWVKKLTRDVESLLSAPKLSLE